MKAILEFNLPEEQEEFDIASNSSKLISIVRLFVEYLRAEVKYNSDKYTEEQIKILESVRSQFFELAADENLNGDILW